MEIQRDQSPVKLIASLIYREDETLSLAEKGMSSVYGPQDDLSISTAFDYTDYYYREFGSPLRRKIVCFKSLVEKDGIKEAKIWSNGVEDLLRADGRRSVNIDPGYVTEAKLVLLTTKDYTHRIYLGGGIFAESTLFFQDGSFAAWPWTYPDYASDELRSFFNRVRARYLEDLKPAGAMRHVGR